MSTVWMTLSTIGMMKNRPGPLSRWNLPRRRITARSHWSGDLEGQQHVEGHEDRDAGTIGMIQRLQLPYDELVDDEPAARTMNRGQPRRQGNPGAGVPRLAALHVLASD